MLLLPDHMNFTCELVSWRVPTVDFPKDMLKFTEETTYFQWKIGHSFNLSLLSHAFDLHTHTHIYKL